MNENDKKYVYLLLEDIDDDAICHARAYGLIEEDEADRLIDAQTICSPYTTIIPLVFEESEEDAYEKELQHLEQEHHDVIYLIKDSITNKI